MRRIIILMLVIAAVSAAVGWVIGNRGHTSTHDTSVKPSESTSPPATPPATVVTATLVHTTFERTLVVYGQVSVPPEAVQGVSAPFDSVISRIGVVIGQQVHTGDLLVDVQPSAEIRQQLAEAHLARTAADQDLTLARERRALSLATQGEVAQAEHQVKAAELHQDELTRRGLTDGNALHHVVASTNGVVVAIAAKPGTAAASGTSLVDLAPTTRREVRLGFVPGDVAAIHVGQTIEVQAFSRPTDAIMTGTVAWITNTLDPATRLIDVVVALPADALCLDHDRMVARIPVSIPDALVVPRTALVSDDNGTKIFVVSHGKAERTLVTVIAENDTLAALAGTDLMPGQVVVSENASLLDDGQAVLVAPTAAPVVPGASSPPSTSAPSTTPASPPPASRPPGSTP